MSGRGPPSRPTLGNYVTAEDVQRELNFIEKLQNQITGQDEYLEAMLTNMRLQAMWMLQTSPEIAAGGEAGTTVPTGGDGSPEGYNTNKRPVPSDELVNKNNLPLDAVGIVNRTVYENDIGPATFQVNGSVFAATVRADDDLASGDPCRIIAPGNIAEPLNDVATSLLGLTGSIGAGRYERTESPSPVTIQPGDTETVLRVNVRGADWISVGTTDQPDTTYQYFVDNEPILDTPLNEPLGLFNDPYQFPTAVRIDREVRVEATLDGGAGGAQDYVSKVTYFE